MNSPSLVAHKKADVGREKRRSFLFSLFFFLGRGYDPEEREERERDDGG